MANIPYFYPINCDIILLKFSYTLSILLKKFTSKGFLEKIAIKKRPGTVGICAAIMNKYSVDTVPHIICGGFNQEETENALIDLDFFGIRIIYR